jgi:hypothetical protein
MPSVRPAKHLFLLFVALAALGGCASMEKECQRVCEWESQCVVGSVGVEDCSAQCVNDTDSRSADCKSAFNDFADCANKNQSCPGVDQQCSGQAAHVLEKCDCTNATGPMQVLCGQ